jgi:two-component system, NarL family, nitrate/nitrite response regulator NarL
MTTNDPLSVLLIDDYDLCRRGLKELLELRAGITVVGTTGDPIEALQVVRQHKPDLVIMDLRMPAMDGVSLLQKLRSEGCDVAVTMLTMSASQEDMAGALRAGARGYLLKDMDPDDVIESIRRIGKGEMVVAPAMSLKLAKILQGGHAEQAPDKTERLTAREQEILQLLASAKSNKVIARELNISHDTVKLHVRHILAKLHFTSRVEAAVYAVEQGLVACHDSSGDDLDDEHTLRKRAHMHGAN